MPIQMEGLRKTHRPWWPFRLMLSVPATLFATNTCLTSCGSAVAGSPSIKFSIALVKTFPFASHARQVAGSVGSTINTGPETSLGASAETQESSSSLAGCGAAEVEVRALEVGRSASSGSATLFRFLIFLSPLK